MLKYLIKILVNGILNQQGYSYVTKFA